MLPSTRRSHWQKMMSARSIGLPKNRADAHLTRASTSVKNRSAERKSYRTSHHNNVSLLAIHVCASEPPGAAARGTRKTHQNGNRQRRCSAEACPLLPLSLPGLSCLEQRIVRYQADTNSTPPPPSRQCTPIDARSQKEGSLRFS